MKQQKQGLSVIILSVCMAVLILDAKTAFSGAKDGLLLCISVVIPSLFPFLFLSAMLPSRLLGRKIPGMQAIGRLCGIPAGAESILLIGLLGGYPVGASIITDTYRQGNLSKSDSERMLGFCSNAGPAFLFGMVGALFENPIIVWILWIIHILSALFVGMILPDKSSNRFDFCEITPVSTPEAFHSSIRTMASICGWVVIFRVILSVFERWLFWFISSEIIAFISGTLELSNGISYLHKIPVDGWRFLLCSGMLAFGGLCVSMQTVSVTKDLGTGKYFPGKVLQWSVSVLVSLIIQQFLFPVHQRAQLPVYLYILLVSLIAVQIFFLHYKKSSRISLKDVV